LNYLSIENDVMKNKNKELANKRNEEENKEFLDSWGRARS